MKYLLASLIFCFSSWTLAEPGAVDFQILEPDAQIEAGSTHTLHILVHVKEGYYAYVEQFRVRFDKNADLKFGEPFLEPVQEVHDVFAKTIKQVVKGRSDLRTSFTLSPEQATGDWSPTLIVRYQVCSKTNCFFPTEKKIETHFHVISPPGKISATNVSFFDWQNWSLDNAQKHKTWILFVFVFLAGFLTSFTPCIFPMIPITLAVIGTRTQSFSRLKRFSLSLAYVFGIALTYSVLGFAAAKSGALFGSSLSNPFVVVAIACVFILMALGMFGVFELQAPSWIRNKFQVSTGHGYVTAFGSGLMAGVVASPCVGPVLVGLLTYVAGLQNALQGFLLLFTFAMGLGFIFLLLGIFSELLKYLPKSGPWLDFVKIFFGTIMLCFAVYYASPLLSKQIQMILYGVILLGVSFHFGKVYTIEKNPIMKWVQRIYFIATAIGIALIVQSFFLPHQSKSWDWQTYSQAKLETDQKDKKIILVYFSADWCVACKELDKLTFSDPRVKAYEKQFSLLYIDATKESAALDILVKKYQVIGLPTLIFLKPDLSELEDLRLTGFENADAFLKKIKAAEASLLNLKN